MTAGFLPGLAPSEMQREKVRKRVRPTSRAQYAVGREKLKGRAANVLRWLAHHYNATAVPPTSGELMIWVSFHHADEFDDGGHCAKCRALYVRRGLSDLQTRGLVESVPHGERICAVSDSKCETWRVKPR